MVVDPRSSNACTHAGYGVNRSGVKKKDGGAQLSWPPSCAPKKRARSQSYRDGKPHDVLEGCGPAVRCVTTLWLRRRWNPKQNI